jgi:NAD-dependent dihydropyrimidine dehydrogenase PreA subunit
MPWLAGVDRKNLNWGPTIDADACVSCGMCMNCGKQVFDWVDGKAVVARYDMCVPGCSTCMNLCLGNAISFPPLAELREFYRINKVWSHVTKVLKNEGKLEWI